MGRPGSGKGTQAQLLKTYLEEQMYTDVVHITTGGTFREFIKGDNFIAAKARDLQNRGGLQPEFLAIWNWTNVFIGQVKENTTVILDGAPRKIIEQEAMHEFFRFTGYGKPYVIYVDVSDAWALDRQKYRQSQTIEKRPDTNGEDEIKRRLELFDMDILPCIAAFEKDPRYLFVHINGQKTIEEVHNEIISKLDSVKSEQITTSNEHALRH